MPNTGNVDNLIPNEQRTPEERRENARKAGIASGKKRRERKAMREAFDDLLSRKFVNRDGQEVQGIEAVAVRVFQKAMDGDLRAAKFIRDTGISQLAMV